MIVINCCRHAVMVFSFPRKRWIKFGGSQNKVQIEGIAVR